MQAYIGPNSHVTASGAVSVTANSTITAEADMFGVSAGELAVGVSLTDVTVGPNVVAALGDPTNSASGGVHITAGSLTVMASTPLSGDSGLAKATGSAGALIGVTSTNAVVNDNTVVKSYVANGAVLSVSGLTNIAAAETTQDEADADSNAFGLVAAGIATSTVTDKTDTEAYLGADVTLGTAMNPSGSLTVAATSNDNTFADTNAGSGGVVGVAAEVADTTNNSTTTASVGARSGVNLTGAFVLDADHTAAFNEEIDSFAGGLFAGTGGSVTNEVTANTTAQIFNSVKLTAGQITISAGATLKSARTANLFTNYLGFANITAQAKAESWVSDLTNAILSGLGGGALLAYANEQVDYFSNSIITNDGTIETGINRHQSLTLGNSDVSSNPGGWNDATGKITVASATPGVNFTTGFEQLSSTLVNQILSDQQLLNQYSANPTLNTYYTNQIKALEAEGEMEGVVIVLQGTSPATDVITPVDKQVMTATVDPIYADAGRIFTTGNQLVGAGQWIAPSDASVTIINNTPAFLEIEGVMIPDDNGGLYFNGDQWTTNTQITNQDQANVKFLNKLNDSGGDPIPSLTAGTAGFAGTLPTSSNGTMPSVTIENTLDVVFYNETHTFTDDNPSPGSVHNFTYAWPDITVVSIADGGQGIFNLQGDVTIAITPPNNQGNINIDGPIEALNEFISAGGEIFIDTPNIPQELGGSPEALWDQYTIGPYDPNNPLQRHAGVAAVSAANVTAILTMQPTMPSLDANSITIIASIINVDGLIQSGKPDYSLNLNSATTTEIQQMLQSGHNTAFQLPSASTGDFAVFFDPTTNRINVEDQQVSGGNIALTGAIVNTGNGQINVLGGYGEMNITNTTPYDLELHRLDASTSGQGSLLITDTSISATNPSVTYYSETAGGPLTVTTNGGMQTNQPLSETYNPVSSWRYGWTWGVEQVDHFSTTIVDSNWLGIIPTGSDTTNWQSTVVEGAPTLQTPGGPYYYTDTDPASQNDPYTFTTVSIPSGALHTLQPIVNTSTSWYGGTTITATFQATQGFQVLYEHDISAHRPIGIQFTGHSAASISVNSDTNVFVDGPILNTTGATTITSGGAIKSDNIAGSVGGSQVVLTAQDGIGGANAPIQTTVGSRLDATTASGNVNIEELTGDLPIDQVVSQSVGTITLTDAGGSILVANGAPNNGLVSGGAINLFAADNVGNSTSKPLLIDTPTATDIAGNKLTVTGITPPASATNLNPALKAVSGNIYLEETTGDLQVNTIDATGNVWIDVPNGSLVNANTSTTVDQRTEAQLLSGVWSALELTDATGEQEQVQAVISTYTAAQEQSYQTYWHFRNEQPDPSVYDPNFEVTLTPAQMAYYESLNPPYTQAQITTLENLETSEYHVLQAEFSQFDDPIVDVANSTIFLGNSTTLARLQTGDQVTYNAEGTSPISFSQGGPYFARLLGSGLVQLYSSEADAVAGGSTGLVTFTYSGAGTGVAAAQQEFTFSPSVHFNPQSTTGITVTFNPSAAGIVNTATGTIQLKTSSGLVTGDQVIYNDEGATAIGGLTSGQAYYVNVSNTGAAQLYDIQSDALAGNSNFVKLTSTGGGIEQALTSAANFGAVDTTADTIFLGAESGLTTGEAVTYDTEGNAPIGGLTNGKTYYVSVRSGGTASLYNTQAAAVTGATPNILQFNPGSASVVDTAANAIIVGTSGGLTSGEQVTYDAEGNTPIGGGLSSLGTYYVNVLNIVDTTNNAIFVGLNSGLTTGEAVTYNAEGNAAVGGLTSGNTYYVNVQSNGTIKLYNSASDATANSGAGNGNFVTLSATGGGSQQELTFGSSQSVSFNPTRIAVRLYSTNATNAMTGGSTGLVTLSSLGGGTRNRLIATNTGLVIFGPGSAAAGTDQKFVIANTTSAIQFNPTGTTIHRDPIVNTSLNSGTNPLGSTIYVGLATGLQTGDAVTYNAGGGNTAIGPLTSGSTYYANVQSNGAILLYDNETDALSGGSSGLKQLTSTGSGTAQTLSFNPSVHFNPNAPSVINAGTDTIFLPPGNGLVTGDAVQYDTEGNTGSFGLTNNATYYVNLQSNGTFKLYTSLSDATANSGAGNGNFVHLSATTGTGADQKLIILGTTTKLTFNPTGTTNFIYTPTKQQVEALSAGIKEWTPNELLYGIGQGLLVSDVTDTVVNVQDTPDVAGAHVTLLTGGSVGQNSGTLEIPVSPGGTYTTQQLLALATAERTDVQFLGAPATNATVNFSGNTITLISDGGSNNWSADGFAVGDYISIEGKTQNSTDGGALDQIIGLTSTVLTLNTTLATETSVQISIAPVVENPVFEPLPLTGQTMAASESVNVNFIGNGFDNDTGLAMPGEIARDDGGSWLADGFQVGDLVQLTGPASSNNSTGGGLAYTVTAITDSHTLDFNPTAPGVVNTTFNTIFVGSNTGLQTGDEITYNAGAGNTAIGGLSSGTPYWVNVQSDGSFELYDNATDANAGGSTGLKHLSLNGSSYGSKQSFAINSAITANSTLVLSTRDVIFTEGTAGAPEPISIGRGQAPTIKDIQIEQIAPFWVSATGRLDITAGTSVFIDSTNNVQIDQVAAGESASYQGNIRIYTIGANTNITNDASPGTANVEGQNLVLESGFGGIGGSGGSSPITIDLVGQGTLTARAQNDISITAASGALPGDNAGNLYAASVYSSSGNVYLTAADSILDPFDNTSTIGKATQVGAPSGDIHLIAGGSIGGMYMGQPDFIGIDASQTGPSVYAYAEDSIWLYQTSLDLDIGEVFANTGDVNLQAQEYIYNQPGEITDVFGNDITLSSILTGIGTAADNVAIYSHYAYDHGSPVTEGWLTASAITDDEVNIYIIQNDNPPASVPQFPTNPKTAPATDNLYLNTVTTGASDVAFITAPLGSILNSNVSPEDVLGVGGVGGNTLLFATNNIGSGTSDTKFGDGPITTEVGHIEGQSTTGSTWVDNSGPLSIGGNLISSSSTGMYAGGSINVTALSPVTVTKSAISEGDINIVASNDGMGGDNIVVDAVTVTSVPLVLQAAGNITLTAGNNITIMGPPAVGKPGALLQAGSKITLKTPEADGSEGNVITVAGELDAPTIEIDGGPADSIIQVTTGILDAAFPWTNGGAAPQAWPFSSPPAGLASIPFPANPATTSQISIFGDGGSEQILLWGTISAKRTDVYAGTGADAGSGNALIALNPTNDDGYNLLISGQVNLWGNTGSDTFVVNKLNTLDLAHKYITGQSGATSIDPGTGGTLAPGVVSVRDTINIYGGAGSNQYDVNLTGDTDYIVNVSNPDHMASPADGSDTLTINGVPGADTFLLRENFVALLQYANGVLQPTYERINYNSSISVLDVNGLEPFDYVHSDTSGFVQRELVSAAYAALSLTSQTNFYVDGNSAITTLTGADGGDTFQFGQVFGSARVGGSTVQFGDQIPTIEVALGYNSIGGIVPGYLTSGPEFATTAYGGAGNDDFFVYSNQAPLKLYGEAGNDDFVVRAFALASGSGQSTQLTTIATGDGNNQIEYNINAPVAIDGGSGINTVTVLGSGFGDSFVITNQGVVGAGLNVSMTNVSILQVDGVAGNNVFYVLSTAPGEVVTLIGGTGNNNTFDVAGDVTTPVIAEDINGISGVINNNVISNDPSYNGIYTPGVSVNVASGGAGAVVIGQLTAVGTSTPIPQLFENTASGPDEGQYTINLAAAPTANVYITVAAVLRPYQDTSQGSQSLEVSDDGGATWHQSLVLTFTPGNYSTPQTIYVKALGDHVAEGQQTIIVSHSSQSADPKFNDLPIANLEVNVIDQTLPDAVLTPAHTGNLQVITGNSSGFVAQSDSFTVQLNRAPEPGETVTVTLNSEVYTTHNYLVLSSSVGPQFTQTATGATITFNSSNWNTPVTVTVAAAPDGGKAFNPLQTVIEDTVTSSGTGTLRFNQDIVEHKLTVTVIDSAVPQVLITPSTPVTVSPTQPSSYTMQLTVPPKSGDTVTVQLLDDGQTLLSSTSPQFTAAAGNNPAYVTFSPSNWNIPVTITVKYNPSFTGITPGNQPHIVFPAQPQRTSAIQGPVIIEGNIIPNLNLSLRPAVKLPTETDVGLGTVVNPNSPATQTNVLNVFNAGSSEADAGALTTLNNLPAADQAGILQQYAEQTLNPLEFGNISGEDMTGSAVGSASSPALTLNYGTILNPIFVSYPGGITYRDVQFVDVMLGSGNDTFTVNATPVQPASSFGADLGDSLTVIQGGGGNNDLIANGSGGQDSALVLLGSTTQDGVFYNSTTQNITGEARVFNNLGNNTLDARNDPNPVILYGGGGNDIIYGGAGGDWIAGGSGNNTIYGGSGNDDILGSDGFNLNPIYETPISQYEGVLASQIIANNVLVPIRLSEAVADNLQVLSVAVSPPTGSTYPDTDFLKAGNNAIYSGSGNNIIVGNLGVIQQLPAVQRILTTGSVISVSTASEADFGNNTIYGDGGGLSGLVWNGGGDGTGNDVILGGSGANTIWGGNGQDIIIGNDGLINWGDLTGAANPPTLIETTDFNYGGGYIPGGGGVTGNFIHGGTLDSIILGGPGDNWIWGGVGNDLIIGNVGQVTLDGLGLGYEHATLIDTVAYIDPITGDHAATTHGPGMTVGAGPGSAGTPGVSDVIQAYPQATAVGPVPTGGGDDIVIGGAGNAWIGGGAGGDLIFGNNVTLTRAGSTNNPRFEALTGTQIYTDTATTDTVNVSGVGSAFRTESGHVPVWANITITNLDESVTTPATHYGSNYIAGGPGDNMIFGGQGTNTIQGAGSILGALNPPSVTVNTPGVLNTTAQVETLTLNAFTTTYSLTFNGQIIDGISNTASAAWLANAIAALTGFSGATVIGNDGGPYTITFTKALGSVTTTVNSEVYAYRGPAIQEEVAPGQYVTALGALHVNPSFEAATDGNNYIEGGGGNGTVIFGGTGQNDIIGGNSNLFSLTTPQQRPDSGNVIIFAGAGTEIGEGNSQSTATIGGTATAGDLLSLTISWVSSTTGLSSNQTISYTVLSGQTVANMVMGLLQMAQNNAALSSAGFSFTVSGNQLVIDSSGPYTLTGAVGGSSTTETITIAQGGATVGTSQGNVHARNASVVVANNGGGPNLDYLFGGSGNDLITGGYGGKWISAGDGETGLVDAYGNPIINTTGILGGDGRLALSRNTSAYREPLYGIQPIPPSALDAVISTTGHIEQSTIDVAGALTVTADLAPFSVDPNGPQDAANGVAFQTLHYTTTSFMADSATPSSMADRVPATRSLVRRRCRFSGTIRSKIRPIIRPRAPAAASSATTQRPANSRPTTSCNRAP